MHIVDLHAPTNRGGPELNSDLRRPVTIGTTPMVIFAVLSVF